MAQPVDSTARLHEDQEFFHGHRLRKEAMSLIHDPGDFLVRLAGTDDPDLVITCCPIDGKKTNLTIESFVVNDKTSYRLKVKPGCPPTQRIFSSPLELIEHYRARGVTQSLKLTRVIPRPEWALKSEFVVYNEETDEIGTGNFGTTFKGLLAKKTGEVTVAIKMPFGAARATAESDQVKEARQEILNEAKTMAYLAHVNVAQFFGLVMDKSPALVVWEWCVGGDLLTHLRKFGKETDAREKTIYSFEISRGLMYLHHNNIVHGSLSARNCLISSRGFIKIGDYGHAKLIDDGSQAAVRWAAPESLPPGFTARDADTWTFGMVIYEIWSNGVPCSGVPARDVAGRIRECESMASKVPGTWPAWVAELLKMIWVAQTEERPSMLFFATELGEIALIANDHRYGPLGPLPLSEFTINKVPGVCRATILDYHYAEFDFYIEALKKAKKWDGRSGVPEDGHEE